MSEKDGGPAFPYKDDVRIKTGMTLRDYLAAKAMAGMLARDEWVITSDLVKRSYSIADAMLKERDK